ncbi:ATP-binding protein [Mediannikoviicoccus vaginalis]|uniref:ATP-binding protein n=1 Tax=Mediannikoviicoccus vaginalis TaxID=2899727 RepID=UPI001F269191|nr:ATP-binding protein [Mediannikoviicoccus vaginalis]
MVKLVIGPSGSGKTKWLIDEANKEKASGNGNIVFVDTDDSHIYSLDHQVRLINANKYHINSVNGFYGFLAGIISRDYDIKKIYVDGIYDIVDISVEELGQLSEELTKLSEEFEVEFYIGLNKEKSELPSAMLENSIELSL